MQVRERDGALQIDDVPGMHWLLGLLMLGVGGLFVAGPLGLFTDAGRLAWWVRIVMALLGVAGVAAGGWTLARAPWSRLTVDTVGDRVRLERWGFNGRAVQEWPLAAIAAVQLAESRDDEGGAVFQVHLYFRQASSVQLSPVWRHGRAPMEQVVRRVAAAAGVQSINVRASEEARV